ncbi:hypothetical protein EYF80_029208 [Liparis tanakae]|uniref:Uncharacterized protein n=1 Tax=Liparis tanakae TaxID=230148 RepID=A0A4Z2H418_9TELE|nr:hypothetical protein EYF80_029208 [Liparis tanakae]
MDTEERDALLILPWSFCCCLAPTGQRRPQTGAPRRSPGAVTTPECVQQQSCVSVYTATQ